MKKRIMGPGAVIMDDSPGKIDNKESITEIPVDRNEVKREDDIIDPGFLVMMPSEEDLLQIAKDEKLYEISIYDKSPAVNSFELQGNTVWVDRDQRLIKNRSLTDEKLLGREVSTIWLNGISFNLPIDTALGMLSMLEVYANDCYNITEKHKAEVNSLKTIDEVKSYDITKGYPEKLKF